MKRSLTYGITVCIGAFFTLSTFLWLFFDFTWWVPAPSPSARELGILAAHVVGIVIPAAILATWKDLTPPSHIGRYHD